MSHAHRHRPHVLALIELTKPRLGFFSVLTAMAAYATVHHAGGALQAIIACFGTACAAGGALSFNQWWERRTDGLMKRTSSRPLPLNTLTPAVALLWSLTLSTLGTITLLLGTTGLAAVLALATILLYGVVYTPLKRRTRWATEVGSISGALPALLGAAAAGNVAAPPAVLLAVILLLWQMPHFFAIGWLHRDEYRAAGFPLLPAVDRDGRRTASWSFGYAALLVLVSVLPVALGTMGPVYGVVAAGAGLWFLLRAWRFVRAPGDRQEAARGLFLGSIVYLPVVMLALVVDRLME